jgi:hypothetical protein
MGELLKAELFPAMFLGVYGSENLRRFLFALAASPRFRDIRLTYYVNHFDPAIDKQFSAVTFLLPDGSAYVAYRGTDTSFVGWKEDFNMAYLSPVPSQQDAVQYLCDVARLLPRAAKIRAGGHSKGGNLAVYSSVHCNPAVQKRIAGVYNHDGPGFKESLFETPEFLRIESRIHTSLPESSLVGMLLQHHGEYKVVKSSRHGVMQHDPFSWYVGEDDFCFAEKLNRGAVQRNGALAEWLGALTDENRKRLTDALFEVLGATKADSLMELSGGWQKGAAAMLGAVKNIDADSRKFITQTVNELAKISLKYLLRPAQAAQ